MHTPRQGVEIQLILINSQEIILVPKITQQQR